MESSINIDHQQFVNDLADIDTWAERVCQIIKDVEAAGGSASQLLEESVSLSSVEEKRSQLEKLRRYVVSRGPSEPLTSMIEHVVPLMRFILDSMQLPGGVGSINISKDKEPVPTPTTEERHRDDGQVKAEDPDGGSASNEADNGTIEGQPDSVSGESTTSVESTDEDSSGEEQVPVAEEIHSESLFAWLNLFSSDDVVRFEVERASDNFLERIFTFYAGLDDTALNQLITVHFLGEGGVDMGALTREFFYVVFEAMIKETIKNQKIFEGSRGHLLPTINNVLLDNEIYRTVGKIIVHAVRCGYRGLPGLSPAVKHYLLKGVSPNTVETSEPPISLDDVADSELHDLLKKIEDSAELTDQDKTVLENWMEVSHCSMVYSLRTRHLVMQRILIHYVYDSRIRQLESLANGLNILKLREHCVKNPCDVAAEFILPELIIIRPEDVLGALVMRGEHMCVRTLEFFQDYVRKLYKDDREDFRLSDLIVFLSGAAYLPRRIVLSFEAIGLPKAHACFCELVLPTSHATFDAFCRAMDSALEIAKLGYDLS